MVWLVGVAADFSVLGRELCPIANSLTTSGYDYAVIGATALLLHGCNILRATRDVDLVVAIAGGFPEAREILVQIGLHPTNISHRYLTENDLQLDILPVAISDTEQDRIEMPGGGSLSAIGLGEAIRSRIEVNLEGCAIAVAALPVVIALKLIAATVLATFWF